MASSSSDISISVSYTLSDYFRDNKVNENDRNEIIKRICLTLIAPEALRKMENSCTRASQMSACAYFRKINIQTFQKVIEKTTTRYPLIVCGDRRFAVMKEKGEEPNIFSKILGSIGHVQHHSDRQGGFKTIFPAIELTSSADPLTMRVFAWAKIVVKTEKVIPTSQESKTEQSFNKEVALLEDFRSPLTVDLIKTIKFIGKEDYLRLGMLMEWCPFTLRNKSQTQTYPKKLQYAKALIEILLMLKAKGIYFRDLKEDNLLIDAEGNLKLADFGVAVPVKDASCFAGTVSYRAPEYMQGGARLEEAYAKKKIAKTEEEKKVIRREIMEIKQRCATLQGDVWAAGIIIYKLFYGNHPIIEKIRMHSFVPGEVDIKKLYEKWLVTDPKAIQTHIDEIFEGDPAPNTIMGILKGMLVLDPEQRFTCEDVKALIDRVV